MCHSARCAALKTRYVNDVKGIKGEAGGRTRWALPHLNSFYCLFGQCVEFIELLRRIFLLFGVRLAVMITIQSSKLTRGEKPNAIEAHKIRLALFILAAMCIGINKLLLRVVQGRETELVKSVRFTLFQESARIMIRSKEHCSFRQRECIEMRKTYELCELRGSVIEFCRFEEPKGGSGASKGRFEADDFPS